MRFPMALYEAFAAGQEYVAAQGVGTPPLRALDEVKKHLKARFDERKIRIDEVDSYEHWDIPREVRERLPDALIKALGDTYDYVLGLRSGRVILFTDASYDLNRPDWITVYMGFEYGGEIPSGGARRFAAGQMEAAGPRGTDIRISEIEWCEDSPFKS